MFMVERYFPVISFGSSSRCSGMIGHLGRMIGLESVRQRVALHCLWMGTTFM
jgi:hypothetical protein